MLARHGGETECGQALGAGILQQLHAQRQTIQQAQQHHQDAAGSLKQSDAILRRMGRWWPF